jgi:hypothetical protein
MLIPYQAAGFRSDVRAAIASWTGKSDPNHSKRKEKNKHGGDRCQKKEDFRKKRP